MDNDILKYYEYVFVVLVYKNTIDILELIDSIKQKCTNYKIVIVNSYFDDMSKLSFEKIAYDNNCHFINIPNKGYSYGNNVGIKFAKDNYNFQYLICSNPDIIIKKFEMITSIDKNAIYCGNIITKDNRKQNPMRFCESKLYDNLIYMGYKKKIKCLLYLGILINKLYNCLFYIEKFTMKKKYYQIFQPHGSFIIFSKNSLDQMGDVFDNNMFLFCEEGVVAVKAKKYKIPIYFIPSLVCFHKEDGSINLWDGSIDDESRKSTLYFYKKYYSFK